MDKEWMIETFFNCTEEESNFIIDSTYIIKMKELAKIEGLIMDYYTKKIIEGIFDEDV